MSDPHLCTESSGGRCNFCHRLVSYDECMRNQQQLRDAAIRTEQSQRIAELEALLKEGADGVESMVELLDEVAQDWIVKARAALKKKP